MTKRELTKKVNHFNRLSDQAEYVFDKWAETGDESAWDLLHKTLAEMRVERAEIRAHVIATYYYNETAYLHDCNDKTMAVVKLEVW